MNADELNLAQNCYGFGRWDTDYWFTGPEQGQRESPNDSLAERARAFRKLGHDGLCDCRMYHEEIGVSDWHIPNRKTRKVKLKSTWKSLILALKVLLDKDDETDADSRRSYQVSSWGSSSGETCVIELSGLPARSFNVPRDRESFRQARLKFIDTKMQSIRPKFVVIYGRGQEQYWRDFWKKKNQQPTQVSERIVRIGRTVVAFAPSPTAPGKGNQLWRELAQDLLQASAA